MTNEYSDDLPNLNGYAIAVRSVDSDEAHALRADTVRLVLREHVRGLKENLDPARWLNSGWAEVESFVEALCSGGMHPALIDWEADKDRAGHPAPSSRELYVRRLAVLMAIGLNRIGLSGRNARRFAADELARAGVFDSAPTAKRIEHWQARYFPALDTGAELLLATGIATAGRDPHKLALYFIGLSHVATNPTAVVVKPGLSPKGVGYLGKFESG
jgi:hypothetical protein